MNAAFKDFFDQIKNLDVRDATEHTLRPALDNLLKALAGSKIKVIHEPKRDDTGKGAPDFKFKTNECILGYLENKKIEENLDLVLKSDQITKYKQLSGNLILTNYLEWVWLKDGAILKRETLCYPSDIGYRKARLDPDKAEKVAALIEAFLSTPPKGIGRAKDLALALAIRCHELREFLREELIRQEQEQQQGKLFGLFGVFKKDVFHELSLADFADAFAQMLGYGLFLARLNTGNGPPISLHNAKRFIPTNFELIRELVDFLDELDKEEYRSIRWLVEEILSIMNTLDLGALREDLAFSPGQTHLFPQTEEERLLFAKDPYVYFYEGFLKAYDKKMRQSRGVYYTPPPVVNFIVRAINDILKDSFGIKQGLADRKRVTVLDFATGTGTFLLEVLEQIFAEVPQGLRDDVIREHALKNLYGFEYLIAPYTIAHLKLSQFLHDRGYEMQPRERLQIYLTNTLEPISPQPNFFLPALSREVQLAQNVKDRQILVITGNPPYSGHSLNKGDWISGLIAAYRQVDGQPLGEKNPKWLQDDYVKFIRFAQWKMDQVEEGVVGIITNHSFLDNPTFRGMRQSLMETFNRMYVLDLHGNTKKKERTPEGGKDENVFDIEQGVSISLLIRKPGLAPKFFHADLWGRRADKYRACAETDFQAVPWVEVQPQSPFYLFIPQDTGPWSEYEGGIKITEIFPLISVGIVTARDDLTIHYTPQEVRRVIDDFAALPTEEARRKYNLGRDTRDWKVHLAQKDLKNSGLQESRIVPMTYRPFDVRYTYYTGKSRGFHCMPRGEVMRHMLAGENVGLATVRQVAEGIFNHALVSKCLIDSRITLSNKGISFFFPLYHYNFQEIKPRISLFDSRDFHEGQDRMENFTPEFRTFIDQKYQHHYTPEEILGYIYAALHSPTYRRKYAEFLKMDFPRVPFVEDRDTFEKLSALGWQLVQAHLLKDIPDDPEVDVTKGSDEVAKPMYRAQDQRLYFNNEQYFSPVPEDVWNFHIGGYQVLDKYLKSRKGRNLSLDEKENIINVVKVLRFTIDQMQAIDKVWRP
ncbi:MAG: DNA methyltransferase [Deltaproteobacteria bacterium]|nr:DNA methyltransferase [Deltaproteobacteria bacterium]